MQSIVKFGFTQEMEKSKGTEQNAMKEETSKMSTQISSPLWKFWKRRRYILSLMIFCGQFNVYILRVNLSIGLVAMTQDRFIVRENGSVQNIGPEFDWSNEIQGYILSSFFYGYISTMFLGGLWASKIGGKHIYGLGIAATSALTLITPWLATVNVYLLIAVRVIEGIFEGVTYPCVHALLSKWTPPVERARLTTFALSGAFVGTVVSMPTCAYFAEALGWESVFYICGASGLLWFITWMYVISSSPEQDTKITQGELTYIVESLKSASKAQAYSGAIPWRKILTSAPVWAIVVSNTCENWGYYTLMTELPKYYKDIYNYDLGQSGFLSALPYLAMAIVMTFSGQLADWLLIKGILSTTQIRKIFNCFGFLGQTVFMLLAGFWSDRIGSVFCLTVAVGLGGFAWSGFSVNNIDIAPQYASVLGGISNTFGTIPGIISPTITGYIVKNPPTVEQWQTVLFIAAGLYLFGVVFYGTFASAELQPWAVETENNKNDQRKAEVSSENKS